MDQRNKDARLAARRKDRERRRIEMGSQYETSDEEKEEAGRGRREVEEWEREVEEDPYGDQEGEEEGEDEMNYGDEEY